MLRLGRPCCRTPCLRHRDTSPCAEQKCRPREAEFPTYGLRGETAGSSESELETDLLEEEPFSETVESDVAALDDAELDRLNRNRDVVHELRWTPQMLLVHGKSHDVPDRLDLVERYHVEARDGVEVYLVV